MKKNIFFVLIFFLSYFTFGQDVFTPSIIKAIPPSVSEFDIYGNIPVKASLGEVNISVPLYVINQDEVSIPISLLYNTKGIKVDQEASWVGLGWDLSFATIYQQINDKNDLLYEEDIANNRESLFRNERYLLPHPGKEGDFPLFTYRLFFRSLLDNRLLGNTSLISDGETNLFNYHFLVTNGEISIDNREIDNVNGNTIRNSNRPLDIFNSNDVDSEQDYFTINLFGKNIIHFQF